MTQSMLAGTDRLLQIRKLTEVMRAITYAASIDDVFQLTVDRAADLLEAEKSLLMVANEDGRLSLRSSHGVDATRAGQFNEPLSESLIPRLAAWLDAHPESFVGVPIVVGGSVTGVLVVIRPPSAGGEQDEWLLSALADQAAVALEKKRLDQVGEFREQLMGIVGHDLRSPLTTISLAAQQLARSEGLDPRQTELASKITRSAKRAARLIHQVLDLTRSRLGGGIPIDPGSFDLSDVCWQVVGESELSHPDRLVRVELHGDLTGVWDRDRVSQLLANLIGNAVEHGEPGSSIDLRVDGGTTDVAIEVFNRGAPIPPEMVPHIFEAFRKGRESQPPRRPGLGLGLGLFIAREIVRAHGGSIDATSSESGTTVRVRLPR